MPIKTATIRATKSNFFMMRRRREGFRIWLFDKGVLSSGSSAGLPILCGSALEGKPCSRRFGSKVLYDLLCLEWEGEREGEDVVGEEGV